MPLFSRAVFGVMQFAARKGLAESRIGESMKERARRTGIHGETYAYWYLRRHGYVFVARNYRVPEDKGEIDLVGYDGSVLAFVEVKTRIGTEERSVQPEFAVTSQKRQHIERVAKRFLRERRLLESPWRFDLVAIESREGRPPVVRLHKNAFAAGSQ
ncbi:MAG TPA: YraN family protein [Candidatus Acidoferrales bacterium]|nr:YraN family protein [Candidatus Acidoferrales bacterium]